MYTWILGHFAGLKMLKIGNGTNHPNIEESQLPYVIERPLGFGGYTIVEEVRDRNTGEKFARKVFRVKRRTRKRLMEVFENERNILQTVMQHDHIINMFAAYTTEDSLGLLLSPVADERDLDHYMETFMVYKKNPSENETLIKECTQVLSRAFGCLIAGLNYMHQKKVRHKDIKPGNILIHRGRPLYTDFGLSLDSSDLENSTTEGLAQLSTRYAAPEVLENQPRNSLSDIYSLGCVFIEMHSVLLGEIYYDEDKPFFASISEIHKQLQAYTRSNGLQSLIQDMTSTCVAQRARATRHYGWVSMTQVNGESCPNCYRYNVISMPNDDSIIFKGIKSHIYISLEPTGNHTGGAGPQHGNQKHSDGPHSGTQSGDTEPNTASNASDTVAASSPSFFTPWVWSVEQGRYYCILYDSNEMPVKLYWSAKGGESGAHHVIDLIQFGQVSAQAKSASKATASNAGCHQSTPFPYLSKLSYSS